MMTQATYRRAKPLAWRDVGGHVVAIHSARGQVSELNGTASEIWRHLEHGATAESLALKLSERFAVEQSEAFLDVTQLLAELETLGLVSGDGP